MIFDFNSFNGKSINESVSRKDIKDLIQINLDDELIEYDTQEGYYSPESYKRNTYGDIWGLLYKNPVADTDRFCYLVQISLWDIKDVDFELPNGWRILNCDDDGVMDAIHNISKIADTKVIFTKQGVNLLILADEQIDKTTDELELLYNEINSRFSKAHSDYANSTLTKFNGDKITIETSRYGEYTDRKFKLILKGLPLEDFNIEQDYDGTHYNAKHVTTITRK